MNRRQFLQATGGAAAFATIGGRRAYAFSQSKPLSKFVGNLRGVTLPPYDGTNIPVALPDRTFNGTQHYQISVGQYQDQLHPSLPLTTLWGYRDAAHSAPYRHLGGIIVATKGTPVQITFTNTLPPTHILPVDTSIPGANQAQNRIATHIHGGLVPWVSDGGPFDWFSPAGPNYANGPSFLNNGVNYPVPVSLVNGQGEYFYPNSQSARLVWYHDHAWGITRLNAYAGVATGYIIRDATGGQEYGLIGSGMPNFIEAGGREIPLVVQDKVFKNGNPQAVKTYPQYELPVGDLWYPYNYERSRWDLKGSRIPRIPSCIAEFFGDTMLVNGTVYPKVGPLLPRIYRLRILNACNARFLNVQIYKHDGSADGITLSLANGNPTNVAGPDLVQIGSEAGFLPVAVAHPGKAPFSVTLDPTNGNPTSMSHGLLMAPAERADVLVDFRNFANTTFVLYTDCPAPFPGGDPINDFKPHGNGMGPDTRTLMMIQVGPDPGGNTDPLISTITAGLYMEGPVVFTPDITPAGNPNPTISGVTRQRNLTLNETFDAYGRLIQYVGTDVPVRTSPTRDYGREYTATATETMKNGDVEIWNIFNLTGDTHPMHFHLVNVQVISRQAFDVAAFQTSGAISMIGDVKAPDLNERGWKETVRMNPGEVIRIVAKFSLPVLPNGADGLPMRIPSSPRAGANMPLGAALPGTNRAHEYVWHCHILEHEEHDMMRPLVVWDEPPE